MTKKKNIEEIQNQFKTLITELRFMELAQLMTITGETPADYVVRLGFRIYMEKKRSHRVRLFYVMKLKEITKVVPEESILEDIIRTTFEMHSPHILDSLCKRLEINIEIFQALNDELQDAYLYHVKDGAFTNVEKLMEVTKVSPSEESIQKAYNHYLREGKLISFTGLKRRTGIPPDRKMILEIFKYYQENAAKYDTQEKSKPEANPWRKRIERLRKAMGTKPQKKDSDG
jgi:hypothetical protein